MMARQFRFICREQVTACSRFVSVKTREVIHSISMANFRLHTPYPPAGDPGEIAADGISRGEIHFNIISYNI